MARNLVLAFSFTLFLFAAWSLRLLWLDSYNVLVFEEPPSAMGPPHVLVKKGSQLNPLICFSDDYVSPDRPVFISKFYVFKDTYDAVHVTSNLPAGDIARFSASLYSSTGQLLAYWPSSFFKPITVLQAESADSAQKDHKDRKVDFELGSPLDPTAFSGPIQTSFLSLGAALVWLLLAAAVFLLFELLPLYRKRPFVICRAIDRRLATDATASSFTFWLGCLAAMVVISVAAWSVLGVRFATVDDSFMSQTMSGYGLDHPDWHVIFVHPFIGMLVAALYSLWPGIPFYPGLLIGLNTLGLTTVIYCLLRRSFNLRRLIGCVILIAVSGLYLITHIQFTMVSFSLALAGVMLILGKMGEDRISTRRLVAAIILFWVGYAVRAQPPPFVLALIGPCALVVWWKYSLPGAKRFLLAAIAGMIVLTLIDRGLYDASPQWAAGRAYDDVRGKLHAVEMTKNYEDNRAVYEAIHWSPNDLNCFNNFIYQNPVVYSKENLTYLLQHLKSPPVSPERLLWDVVICILKGPFPVCLYLVWLLVAWGCRLLPRLALIALASTWLAGIGYLNLYIRLPERIFAPAAFIELSVLLLLVSLDRPLFRRRTSFFAHFFFFAIQLPIVFYALSGLYQSCRTQEVQRQATVSTLNYLAQIHYAPVIVNTIPGTSVEKTYLWQNFPELQNLHLFQLTYFQNPVYAQRAAHLGIDDVLGDLAHRPDMVLAVSRIDLDQAMYIQKFIGEHYNRPVKIEVAKIPGTNQDAVFPYFSLFKISEDRTVDAVPQTSAPASPSH